MPITVRLKVGEASRDVTCESDDTVSTMKQRAFAEELDAGHTIRLFYSGKELKDASTLSSCGLQNGAVAHALVRRRSEPAPPPAFGQTGAAGTTSLSTLGFTLVTGAIVGGLWWAKQRNPELFSTPAVGMLVGLSGAQLLLTFKTFSGFLGLSSPSGTSS